MDGRLFGLDIQLIFDALIMFIFIMLLYVILSNLFFKPVRAFLEKRQEGIDQAKTETDEDNRKADELKSVYEAKLKEVNKEAENLMSLSRRQALKQHEEIIAGAKAKASEILIQARQEAFEEKSLVKNDVKHQMADIAGLIAGEFVTAKDPFRREMLVEETLKEMGGDAWQS